MKISRRRILTIALSLGAASFIPPLRLGEAREIISRTKEEALLKGKPVRKASLRVKSSPMGTTVNDVFLNETAAHVFSLCDGRHSGYEIALALKNTYDIPLRRATDDTIFTLSALTHLRLIDL